MRWSQTVAVLKIKICLPDSITSGSQLDVRVTSTEIFVGTKEDSDPIVWGEFDRRVDPEGENFAWYLVPDERPPVLDMLLDKDRAEVFQTGSYGELLWNRLFNDDVML